MSQDFDFSHGKSISNTSLNGGSIKKADDKKKVQSRWHKATRGTRSFLFGKGKDNGEVVGGGREGGGSNGGISGSHEMVNGDPLHSNLPDKKSLAEVGRTKSVWKEHVWSTFIHRADDDEGEELVKGAHLLTDFQRAKFKHFFYHVLDLNSDHVISQEDFDGLNERVRHYMDWSKNSIYYLSLKEVHSLFLEHFLTTSAKLTSASDNQFDFCDPFSALNNTDSDHNLQQKDHVSIDEWVDVWGHTVGKARKMADLPMWLQYYPKTLFETINRSGTGEISKKELKLFYTAFMDAGRLGDRALNEQTEQAYSALTSGEDVPLTYQVYKLSFLNFLIGKQPNGPGQFIFGPVEAKSASRMFPIDYSAFNSSKEEIETYSRAKLEEKGNRKSVIV